MKNNQSGFSLFEMLIVIFIFGLLGTLTTQVIMLSLRGAAKSESLVKVREDLNSTLAVMERELRGATSIVSCHDNVITYINSQGLPGGSFACESVSNGSAPYYVASASANMTGSDIAITSCHINCPDYSAGSPPSVTIDLTAHNTNKSGVESASMDVSTQIYLRNY